MQIRKYFLSNTLMGKEESRKIEQLLMSLLTNTDSTEFREPVNYLAYGLLDYPTIVKRPMDLGTVRRNLSNGMYQTVEGCLADIQLIWENCKLYNTPDNVNDLVTQWVYKMADKLQKVMRKMIKNYVPFVVYDGTDRKRVAAKKELPKKGAIKALQQAEPKDYLQLKNPDVGVEEPIESQFSKKRKQFLLLVPLCSQEQVGVVFLLIKRYCEAAIEYDEQGKIKINMEAVTDSMLKRLMDQFDLWGLGFAPVAKKK